MSTVSIHPSTLNGIKRLAKFIKHERGIKHNESLNEAARQAGFENFRHAQNVLPSLTANTSSLHVLFITAYWRERNSVEKGRETLTICLSAQWESLVTRRQLKCQRALMEFRGDAPDHLERVHDVDGQEHAREAVCAAARAMQFIDAKICCNKMGINAMCSRGNYKEWATIGKFKDNGGCDLPYFNPQGYRGFGRGSSAFAQNFYLTRHFALVQLGHNPLNRSVLEHVFHT